MQPSPLLQQFQKFFHGQASLPNGISETPNLYLTLTPKRDYAAVRHLDIDVVPLPTLAYASSSL
jgi:hypothetical protein